MLHEELTGKILQACFEVSNELGIGFLESVYQNSLLIALRQKGLKAEKEADLKVRFRDVIVGEFKVDILVEEKVIVELKAVNVLVNEHKAQTINYLKVTGLNVAILVNFGNPKLEYRRFENNFIKQNKSSLKDFLLEAD